ncbi:MAG: redoxin domain-containing protein [Ktedonobacterales bacterium]|nr:redoxin domain-containing protein [Ktedonobacterales bacterium]
MRLKVGQDAPLFVINDIYGRRVPLAAYQGTKLLLSFHRSSVCPLCNIRLSHLIYRYQEYQRQGFAIIAFYESSLAYTRRYLDRLQCPFPIIADRERTVYSLYGLESSWLGTARGTLRRSVYREAKRHNLGVWRLLPGFLAMDGKKFRMPAEFLLGPDLRIQRAYYAKDAGDFLPFSELDAFAASGTSVRGARTTGYPLGR